jgi:CBS domain-containing protein
VAPRAHAGFALGRTDAGAPAWQAAAVNVPVPGLDLERPPFDFLDAAQRARLAARIDLGYFHAGQRLITAGEPSAHVHVILKGQVQASDPQRGADARFADYGPGELFGAFAVIAGRARHTYVASQDTLCHLIPADAFTALLAQNPRFAAWFHEALAVKRRLLAEQQQPGELQRLMLTRVRDAQLAPARAIDPQASIAAAASELRAHRVDCLLVEDAQAGPGIVTRTDLLDALTARGLDPRQPVGPLASRPLLAVRADEVLFQALVTMTEHHVERVVVMQDDTPVGTLGMAEVLAHYASSSHLISLRLARAASLDEVADAARGMTDLVRQLHAQGARMSYLMELVGALNRRILQRVFESVVPEARRAGLCLLVLGSEGRREQILRTDQDNALILADGYDWPGLPDAMQRFTGALAAIGYPPCPGGVMVSNPHWRLSLSQWRERIAQWSRVADGRTALDLAILLDARPLAGDASLYDALQPALQALGRDQILLRYLAEGRHRPQARRRVPAGARPAHAGAAPRHRASQQLRPRARPGRGRRDRCGARTRRAAGARGVPAPAPRPAARRPRGRPRAGQQGRCRGAAPPGPRTAARCVARGEPVQGPRARRVPRARLKRCTGCAAAGSRGAIATMAGPRCSIRRRATNGSRWTWKPPGSTRAAMRS